MSETRYTPEQMREWADSPNSSHSTAAMLRQAATDAEALAAKDKEIARLTEAWAESRHEVERLNGERCLDRDVTARLREALQDADGCQCAYCPEHAQVVSDAMKSSAETQCVVCCALTAERQKVREFRTWVEMRSGEDWVESADLVLTKLDALALSLTGDATEGQG